MHGFALRAFGATVLTLIAGSVTAAADTAGATAGGLTEVVFSAAERALVADYYSHNAQQAVGNESPKKYKGRKANKGRGVGPQGLPPGLAKKQRLPPGIAKRQLPDALTAQLPSPPDGFERMIVDTNLVLVETATQVVHDVISGIVTE